MKTFSKEQIEKIYDGLCLLSDHGLIETKDHDEILDILNGLEKEVKTKIENNQSDIIEGLPFTEAIEDIEDELKERLIRQEEKK